MSNIDIRIAMLEANIKQYELAKKLKITEFYLCRKLRYELSKEEKQKILIAIEELKKEKTNV